MRRFTRRGFFFTLTGVLIVAAAGLSGCDSYVSDPSDTQVTLTGLVRESGTNSLISGATVGVQGQTATTGADGRFTIGAGLTAGSTALSVSHQGHQNVSQTVTLAGATTQDVTLSAAPVAAFIGNWSGNWVNSTFGSTGDVTMVFGANTVAQTVSVTVDLNGTVFGAINPPAFTITGPYVPNAVNTVTGSAFGGTFTATFTPPGQISGSVTGIPVAGISRVDFTGTVTGTTVTLNYTVTFSGGGTAIGTLTLTK